MRSVESGEFRVKMILLMSIMCFALRNLMTFFISTLNSSL